MKQEEMRQEIANELAHISRGKRGSDQNSFREYYNGMRMTDLGQNPALPAKDTFIKALNEFKKDHPDFSLIYDRDFFQT